MKLNRFSSVPSVIWRNKMSKIFREVVEKRYGCLDHFAVNFILPDKSCANICSNPNYILTYRDMEMYRLSSGLIPELLDSLPVIPWRLLLHGDDNERLQHYIGFKEVLHGLYSGMSFVHKVGEDCYLNVAVASHAKDPRSAIIFLNHAEDILNLGSYIYDHFRRELSEFIEYNLPPANLAILNDKKYRQLDMMARSWRDKQMFILTNRLLESPNQFNHF